MKPLIRFFFCCLVCLSAVSAKPKKPRQETWNSANGHSFQGTYVDFQNGKVRLKGVDGKMIDVPVNMLDEESKARVFEYSGAAGIANPLFTHTSPGADIQFGDEPGRQHLQIRLKKGGQTIPYYGAINIRLGASEVITREDGKRNRRSMKVSEIVTEKSERGSGVFRIKYDKGIETLITLKAVKDGVEFTYKLDVSPKSVDNPNIGASFRYPPILEFTKEDKLYRGPFSKEPVPFAKMDAMFANYVATATNRKGDTSFTFDESPKGLGGDSITFSTPNTKDIVVEAVDKGAVKTSFYGGAKLIEGFNVGLSAVTGRPDAPAVGKSYTYRISLK